MGRGERARYGPWGAGVVWAVGGGRGMGRLGGGRGMGRGGRAWEAGAVAGG